MVLLLDDGLNRIRDLVDADIFKCQAGTGTTSPTDGDTGLESADAGTLATPTITTADRGLQVTFLIPSTTGSGTTYSEYEIQMNAGTDHLTRSVHQGLTKGSQDEYTYITSLFIDRG